MSVSLMLNKSKHFHSLTSCKNVWTNIHCIFRSKKFSLTYDLFYVYLRPVVYISSDYLFIKLSAAIEIAIVVIAVWKNRDITFNQIIFNFRV